MRNRLVKARPHSNLRPGFSIHLDSSEGGTYLFPTVIRAGIPSQLLKQPPLTHTVADRAAAYRAHPDQYLAERLRCSLLEGGAGCPQFYFPCKVRTPASTKRKAQRHKLET
ncbi:hypothetical protein B0T16DRAFT_56268 [Cercophora newfieldiana]|uniref:Uncharacterized protein n=1 Tax=Cercophora newfieldiana TaxID=92897 RepID=A0AA39YSP6_9PEZI|nr:hypothetical protein B0T16DRAFT_56268 [Cercophora newfieldiana]